MYYLNAALKDFGVVLTCAIDFAKLQLFCFSCLLLSNRSHPLQIKHHPLTAPRFRHSRRDTPWIK